MTLHPSHTDIADNGRIFMVQTKYYRVQSAQCDTTNWFNYSANEVMTQCFARPELLFRSQPYLASAAAALKHNLKIQYLHLNMSMMMQCSGKDATEYCNCSFKEHLINKYLNRPVLQCNCNYRIHVTLQLGP